MIRTSPMRTPEAPGGATCSAHQVHPPALLPQLRLCFQQGRLRSMLLSCQTSFLFFAPSQIFLPCPLSVCLFLKPCLTGIVCAVAVLRLGSWCLVLGAWCSSQQAEDYLRRASLCVYKVVGLSERL